MSDGKPLETTITKDSHHRNIVNTLDYAIVTGEEATSQAGENGTSVHDSAQSKCPRNGSQVWMMLEYCDRGSLQVR